MSLSLNLAKHATLLAAFGLGADRPEADAAEMINVSARRAVSAAYYALFHRINSSAASLIAPHVTLATNYRIQRWFDHGEMKKICGRFIKPRLDQPLFDLVGPSVSPDLQNVASSFIVLQEARHRADYDLSYNITLQEAQQLVSTELTAMTSWNRIAHTAEANIFILSLLMFKNWEDKFRP